MERLRAGTAIASHLWHDGLPDIGGTNGRHNRRDYAAAPAHGVLTRSRWLPVLVAALGALAVSTLGGMLTDTGPWYEALQKPQWQPPGWVFGPVWTTIYILAAAAAVLAWNASTTPADRRLVAAAFVLNGALNVAWSGLFFALRRPDWALGEIVLLWLSIAWLVAVCARRRDIAAWLLAPYLAWVSFAALLNYTIVRLNGPFPVG